MRWGKSSNGSPPKRRTVLTVPEMDWVVAVLQQWTEEVRPLFSPGAHPALWVTERRGRLSRRAINEAFEEARGAAGLDPVLDLHCLRDLYHAPDRVRLPGAVRARPGRSLLCEHDGDLHELSGIASAGRETAGQLVSAGAGWVQEPDGGCLLTWARLVPLPLDA